MNSQFIFVVLLALKRNQREIAAEGGRRRRCVLAAADRSNNNRTVFSPFFSDPPRLSPYFIIIGPVWYYWSILFKQGKTTAIKWSVDAPKKGELSIIRATCKCYIYIFRSQTFITDRWTAIKFSGYNSTRNILRNIAAQLNPNVFFLHFSFNRNGGRNVIPHHYFPTSSNNRNLVFKFCHPCAIAFLIKSSFCNEFIHEKKLIVATQF